MNEQSLMQLRTGSLMPLIGIGTWQLTDDTSEHVKEAIDVGFRMIDTSGDYGTQSGVGAGIRASTIPRGDVYVVTKVEETDNSYEAAIENLNELGMDYVDLLLIHRPPEEGFGKELWEGLIRAQSEGMTREIGVSNYTADQIEKLRKSTGIMPVVNQVEWSPFGHSMELLGYCQENNIVLQAYSPLTRAERLDDPRLERIGDLYNKSPSQVLLRWDLQLGVVPIVKAGNPEHLEEDFDVFDFELSFEDMRVLRNMNESYSALGSLPYV